MVQLLLDAGFNEGWAVAEDVLVIWEHDTDPPPPLKRPTNETPNSNS
jgi:hypothetical protein